MVPLPSYFSDFISKIRPDDEDLEEFRKAHTELRERLMADETLSKIIVSTFLQGSYKRSTAIRPKPGEKGDVDVVVVTNIDHTSVTPDQAIQMFVPFVEKHYMGKYEIQGRSIGITLEHVALDLVITAAPSEADQTLFKSATFTEDLTLEEPTFVQKVRQDEAQWTIAPLLIPDRDAQQWVETDPLRQIKETQEKNARCDGYYLDVVKALKWWKQKFDNPKHPKGYPLEHLIWTCCPDGITSIAQGVTETLEAIVRDHPTKPVLPDHGVPDHDVMKRVTEDEYALFYQHVQSAATLARSAYDEQERAKSAQAWWSLFGDPFPKGNDSNGGGDSGGSKSGGGYTPRTEPSRIEGGGRFA